MRKFDTQVQYLKYKVLRETARMAWNGTLLEHITEIPKIIMPGKTPTLRCCVYKERAILAERVQLAIGGDKTNSNVIEVIDIACDECPFDGYEVTDACRGCIAHHCMDACRKNAIYIDHQRAQIDKNVCVECGMCAKACPYSAIVNRKRPCVTACKVKAISMDEETKAAKIDNEKCISCGACVYQCPFGAISEKSFILNVIDLIQKSENNKKYKIYAVVAPSISSQFTYATLGQVVGGLRELGFFSTVEAALGADLTSYAEAKELAEKGFLTSSCCPAFVSYIEGQYPTLKEHISHNLSPMAMIAKYMKEQEPDCKIVFIGPCTAKKMEFQRAKVGPYIDCVITFEELQALFDSRDLDITQCEETPLDNASYYGRIFARSGGLSDAVVEALKEQGITDFELKPVVCDGIEQCRTALIKASKNLLSENFIEGMACIGGCIGGAGCLTHGEKNRSGVDKYGREALEKTIEDAIFPIMATRK